MGRDGRSLITREEVSELTSLVDNKRQVVRLVGLEWEAGDLIVKSFQIFKPWTRRISRDLNTPVADGASVLVVFFDLTASDLKTLVVVPRIR